MWEEAEAGQKTRNITMTLRPLQKAWQNKIVTAGMLLEHMNKIDGNTVIRDRALFAFLYLTGARVQEVVRYNSKQQPWPSTEGIRKSQVVVNPDDPERVTVWNVRCLKRKLRTYKKVQKADALTGIVTTEKVVNDKLKAPTYRNIAIRINNPEKPFWTALQAYMDGLPADSELFPFTPQNARQRLYKSGVHPHALRHQRFTHYVDLYHMPSQQLRRQAGWASSATADHYVESQTDDIHNTMTPR